MIRAELAGMTALLETLAAKLAEFFRVSARSFY